VRTTIGGLLLVGLAYASLKLLGRPVTLGAGLPVANELLSGHHVLWMTLAIFALKLFATSVTFGCGGVGELFVPSATMGAAIGAAFDAVLAPAQPGVYTLLGIAAAKGIDCSLSRRGNPYDNAVMESWNSTFKMECGERFLTNDLASVETFDYIEVFYNRKRIHSALGYVSPAAFERQHLERQAS
jgi:hypothetical protein